MASEEGTGPARRRRRVVMNEAAGFERVKQPTEQDRARLAEEAARDIEQRHQVEKGGRP